MHLLLLACATPSEDVDMRRGPNARDTAVSADADTDADSDSDSDSDADADSDADSDADTDCLTLPAYASPDPPTDECKDMDWELSPDGWYLVSQFGTSNDSTTWGGDTTCHWVQATYDYYGCRYDSGKGECLDDDDQVAWIQGDVDYDYSDVVSTVNASAPGDVDWPEVFYVAGAQRFGCGATLRVTNPENGRCVVVYAEDGGPNILYESEDYGGRRILDSSPAVIEFLDIHSHGWGSSQLLYVEFGKSTDVPGQACTPCAAGPAGQGNEHLRSPWDPDHMTGVDCR